MPTEPQHMPHQLILDDRQRLSVSGVSQIDSFDDNTVVAHTALGELTIKGRELHICRLNTETGDLTMEGHIHAMEYNDLPSHKGGRWHRLFR